MAPLLMSRREPSLRADGEPVDLTLSKELMRELVKLRKRRKIGQDEVADAIGVGQSRISQIEHLKRNIHLETVLGYAKAIGCRIVVDAAPEKGGERNNLPEGARQEK